MAASDHVTSVSTKGQVVLPKAIRDLLNWDTGTRLTVEQTVDGVLLRPLAIPFPATNPDEVFGCLPYKGQPKSIEDMDSAVAIEAERRNARGRY